MEFHIELVPILSIIAGIVILINPKILSYIVGIYLILVGVLRIIGMA